MIKSYYLCVGLHNFKSIDQLLQQAVNILANLQRCNNFWQTVFRKDCLKHEKSAKSNGWQKFLQKEYMFCDKSANAVFHHKNLKLLLQNRSKWFKNVNHCFLRWRLNVKI